MINSKDISVIIQGPVYQDFVKKTIENIHVLLPGAEIIISTWDGQCVEGLNVDQILLNTDPGAIKIIDEPPTYASANRQIVSTLAGLKQATRKYAIKMRSDIYFEHTGFLKFYGKFKERGGKYKILTERVILSTLFTPNPHRYTLPYHPSDWFYFGLKDDLINIFDIPLCPEPETSRWFEYHSIPELNDEPYLCRYRTEQYIWYSFLKKHLSFEFEHAFDISNGNIERSEHIFANNSVLVDPVNLGYRSYRYPNLLDGRNIGSFSPYYYYYEWLKLYKKYCDPRFKLPLLDLRRWIGTLRWICLNSARIVILKAIKSYKKR
jgi:hypothetical protein